jgi:hypothetical protein
VARGDPRRHYGDGQGRIWRPVRQPPGPRRQWRRASGAEPRERTATTAKTKQQRAKSHAIDRVGLGNWEFCTNEGELSIVQRASFDCAGGRTAATSSLCLAAWPADPGVGPPNECVQVMSRPLATFPNFRVTSERKTYTLGPQTTPQRHGHQGEFGGNGLTKACLQHGATVAASTVYRISDRLGSVPQAATRTLRLMRMVA